MKLSHADYENDLNRSKDLGDYYERIREGIEEDIKNALELLNPYNGRKSYADRLTGCGELLIQIAMHLEELSNEF